MSDSAFTEKYWQSPTKGAQRMSEKIRGRLCSSPREIIQSIGCLGSDLKTMSVFSKDYVEEEAKGEPDKQWPHSACIIDVTRCSVAFANAEDLMEGFERVMDGTCQEEFGCRTGPKSSFAVSLSLSLEIIPTRLYC